MSFVGYSPDEDIKDVRTFLEEVHDIDVRVYSKEDAGEVEPMVVRYMQNPETFVYVRDEETKRLAGYINFFPVKKSLKKLILSPDASYSLLDDAIPAKQVALYRKNKSNFIYILSVVVAPEYQGTEAIRILTDEFISFLKHKHLKEDCPITAIAGCVVSDGGEKFCKRLRLKKHHVVTEGTSDEHEKAIYLVDNSAGDGVRYAGDLSKLFYLGIDIGGDNDASSETKERYIKTWEDDVYLYLPMTENSSNTATDVLFSENDSDYPVLDPDQKYDFNDDEIHTEIIEKLKDSIDYECSSQAIQDMAVHFIGCYDFLHTIDTYPCISRSYDPIHDDLVTEEDNKTVRDRLDIENDIRSRMFTYYGSGPKPYESFADEEESASTDEEIVVGLKTGYVFITSHRPTHMYVVNVFFPNYEYSTTQLEDQISNDYLKIVDPRVDINPYNELEKVRFIRLYDYLWEKYSLHKCGQEKILLCMSNKPDICVYRTEFENILAAEVYNSTYQSFHVHSKELVEKCNTDRSQYDYYQVYMSDRVIAFILNDFCELSERIGITATYSFIAELIMFQNTALARMNVKVSDKLYHNDEVTMDDVIELEHEYGKSIPFWEPSNFSYMGTASEAGCIKEAFSNDELLESYNKHQDYLEHMADLIASERENNNSVVLNVVATVLALIQVESFFVDILKRFYLRTNIEVAPEYSDFSLTFSNTLLGILFFIVLFMIIRKNRRKHERSCIRGRKDSK